MKISLQQFLGLNHSWSIVGQNLARSFKEIGHDISLCSTNGYDHFPVDLLENIDCKNCIDKTRVINNCQLENDYDIQISYTAMQNWQSYLRHGNKNRFGIWNYDGTHIPKGWAKYHKHCDVVLPSSQYSKDTFIRNGVPEDCMVVVPHGVSNEFLEPGNCYPIKTDRKYKFLVNIAQSHTRKNIPGILDAWGKAFTIKDDVCLVAKVSLKKPKDMFEVSFMDLFLQMKRKHKNHAPVIIVNDFITNISDLYRSCDIGLSLSNVECFNLPALEMMSLGKITIGSNYGGNVDFMNENNSLLVNGKIGRAPFNYQYWEPHVNAQMFYPNTDDAVELMRLAVLKYDNLNLKFSPELKKIKEKYTWKNVVKQIIGLVK